MERKIIANWIMAPDGTMIPSMNRHDYRTHTTVDTWRRVHPEGQEEPDMSDTEAWNKWQSELKTEIVDSRFSMADGGTNYLRRGGVYTEMSVYDDDPFEVIRRFVCRGGRGVDGKQPLTYVPLFRMDSDWLEACIAYTPNNYYNKFYQMELDYRKNNQNEEN